MVNITIDVSSMLLSDYHFHYSNLPPERMVLVVTNEFIIGLKLSFYEDRKQCQNFTFYQAQKFKVFWVEHKSSNRIKVKGRLDEKL